MTTREEQKSTQEELFVESNPLYLLIVTTDDAIGVNNTN